FRALSERCTSQRRQRREGKRANSHSQRPRTRQRARITNLTSPSPCCPLATENREPATFMKPLASRMSVMSGEGALSVFARAKELAKQRRFVVPFDLTDLGLQSSA